MEICESSESKKSKSFHLCGTPEKIESDKAERSLRKSPLDFVNQKSFN